MLADDLAAHGIQYGSAVYEDAYITDFFAGERVMLTSTGKVRIAAYDEAAARNAASAVRAIRQPCAQGRRGRVLVHRRSPQSLTQTGPADVVFAHAT